MNRDTGLVDGFKKKKKGLLLKETMFKLYEGIHGTWGPGVMTERANRQWAVGVVMFGIAMTREKS
jgi:hypothetical protein